MAAAKAVRMSVFLKASMTIGRAGSSVFATSARGAFVDALHVTLLVAVAVALVAAAFVITLLGRRAMWELPSAIEAAGDVAASRPRTTPGTDAA
jgi:hypothetical protein